jgi:hypothetical protein
MSRGCPGSAPRRPPVHGGGHGQLCFLHEDHLDREDDRTMASGDSAPRAIDCERRLRAAYHIFQVIQAVAYATPTCTPAMRHSGTQEAIPR